MPTKIVVLDGYTICPTQPSDDPHEFQIGAIIAFQSGYAFTGTDPNLGDVDSDGRSSDSIADTGLGSPIGNGERGGFRGDSFSQIDLRVAKKFTIAERFRPQVFFEIFNLFNAKNEKPDSVENDINSPNFGISPSVAGQPWRMQISARFDF